MTLHRCLRWLQSGFVILGLLLLALWAGTDFESRGFQSAASEKLEAAMLRISSGSSESAPRHAAWGAPPASIASAQHATAQERVLGRIEIPRLRITAMVAEGTDTRTLLRAVGHIMSTALPGSPGNCALAGHRDTFLRGLGDVRVNDVIRIATIERTYTYRVEWAVVVEPHRVDVLDSTATRSLTLVTCYPFAFVGRAPQRFVVRARQVEGIAKDWAGEHADDLLAMERR